MANRNPYDAVTYPTWPRLETHPDRLAAVGKLFGMNPAPVSECRVLEIGSGDGSNLIPMAYALPGSRFTGIDLARGPTQEARRRIGELRLRNIRVRRADLRHLPQSQEKFDYIIAHGVYSWVPAETRNALLSLCRERMAPSGIAFISYNTNPGRQLRQMLRAMMLHHTNNAAEATHFLTWLHRNATVTDAWRALLAAEIENILARGPETLFHDDLAPINEPVYFHEFAAHSARHGLRYLGDAHLHEMVDHGGALFQLSTDRLVREQYLDFLKLRRFRQTLLCHAEVRFRKEPTPAALEKLCFSSPGRVDGEWIEGANQVRIRAGDPAVDAIAAVLAAQWPRPVEFQQLRNRIPAAREIIHTLLLGGFVEPHAWEFPAPRAVSARPEASAVARLEATRSRFVTNLCHRTVELEEPFRALLPLMDGTRDHRSLTRDWTADPRGPSGRAARRDLEAVLEWMAKMALLRA